VHIVSTRSQVLIFFARSKKCIFSHRDLNKVHILSWDQKCIFFREIISTYFFTISCVPCVSARPSRAVCRSRCPPWSQGCSARPPTTAGVWYKHLDGGWGFPVQGVRFGARQVAPARSNLIFTMRRRSHKANWLCKKVPWPGPNGNPTTQARLGIQ
jgi:hypothetical protein